MNFISVGPFSGSSRLGTHCSSMGLPRGHRSFQKTCTCMGHNSCQKPAPAWALHRLQLPSGHIYLIQHSVLHGLQCGYLSTPLWTSMVWRGQPASPWSSPWAVEESLLQHLEHLLTSLSTDLGVCKAASLAFSHPSLTAFFSTLKYGITEVHWCHWLAQLWQAVGSSWAWLKLSLSDLSWHLVPSYRSPFTASLH